MAFFEYNGIKIKLGNFAFVSEIWNNCKIEQALMEMEEAYWVDTRKFASKMRDAYESLVMEEFARLYPLDVKNCNSNDEVLEKLKIRMQNESENNFRIGRITSEKKRFLIMRCCGEESVRYFKLAVEKLYEASQGKELYRDVKRLITDIYAFASDSIHNNGGFGSREGYELSRVNCKKYMEAFFYFIRGYCQCYYSNVLDCKNVSYDEKSLPLGKYYPISKLTENRMRLKSLYEKKYYFKIGEDKSIKFFIANDERPEQNNNREIDVLKKIWEDDSDSNPQSIIRYIETISLDDTNKIIFALPSEPLQMNEKILNTLSNKEKEDLFNDACHAIYSMHHSNPPYFHRDITPEVFICCRIKTRYKLFLGEFSCTKDNNDDVEYTVIDKVRKNPLIFRKQPYIAPEVKDNPEEADWEKADLYSLGMLGCYLFTTSTDLKQLTLKEDIKESVKKRIMELSRNNPEERTLSIV